MFAPVEDRFATGAASPAALYRRLTGVDPAVADIATDAAFDRHVLACAIVAAAAGPGGVAAGLGLSLAARDAMLAAYFPHACGVVAALAAAAARSGDAATLANGAATAPGDEFEMVRDLLLAHRSRAGSETDWLAAIVARRALEPNHLWEDLGLRSRVELTRLLERHFAPLAAKNTRNMRWKRFFYRTLCEDDGFVLCATPTCTGCGDFETCFGEETGESRLAHIRRTVESAISL
ncbi:nitrogen fixation protein NifQ [Blastochloris sulfoviridis]|uniref:Nitrogen fixation protein NifQ n=1 Tax=Blastochloris sulfoviridis TaxID=50712 RepID=A0A5M6I1I5_9HYPH|nr:nitrogen fixation protein NifQ [Blastochloris sulfoviridis]KAA5602036.1 nitrogen fixation protein NifQ [Blastochloris sulfoviridis]